MWIFLVCFSGVSFWLWEKKYTQHRRRAVLGAKAKGGRSIHPNSSTNLIQWLYAILMVIVDGPWQDLLTASVVVDSSTVSVALVTRSTMRRSGWW